MVEMNLKLIQKYITKTLEIYKGLNVYLYY